MVTRFNGQVAVVTGAGGGIGRTYALALAARGANVVVNDLGVALTGDTETAQGTRPADAVVAEIREAGGQAVANFDDVLQGARIVDAAIKAFGRIDILVNNAGILRDSSFGKMAERDWDLVLQVHVKGAFSCTRAAWPYMMRQKFGRIVNTTSASGLYGNFGQTNYSTAKMALVGMAKTLAAEGAKYNIMVNCVAPLAGTRMTKDIFPPALTAALKPECVAPIVLYLSSKECSSTGQVFEVGAGWVATVRWQRNAGKIFPSSYSVDDVSRDWQQIIDFGREVSYPNSLQDSLMMVSQQLSSDEHSGAPAPQDTKKAMPQAQQPSQLKSATIFNMIAAYLDRAKDSTATLKTKVNSCFHFEIAPKQGQPPALNWTIDLRSDSEGRAVEGLAGNADATFALADDTFVAICLRKLNPQIAFLHGKMKIRGSMAKATKFTPDLFPNISQEMLDMDATQAMEQFLKSVTPGASVPVGSSEDKLSPEASKLQSAQLYPLMKQHLNSPAGTALVKQVNCIYRVDLTGNGGSSPCTLYINLKTMPPSIREMPNTCSDPFDCCFSMSDDVFMKIAAGKLNPQFAFMQGKMKIKGSTQAAMKFTKDMFPRLSRL